MKDFETTLTFCCVKDSESTMLKCCGPIMARGGACLIFIIGVAFLNPLPAEGLLCNITKGEWVLNTAKPLYTETSCRFSSDESKCQSKGRPNLSYQKYEWKTSRCPLEPFSAPKLAQVLKSKTILIVGDSITAEFSEAFLCMANSGSVKLRDWKGTIAGVRLVGLEYPGQNFHILRTFSNFLVERLPSTPGSRANKVNLARVDPRWEQMAKAADVIVFQSSSWWFTGFKEYYSNKKKLDNLSDRDAYAMGMLTVRKYLKFIKFKGEAMLLSASPMHYSLPAGVAEKGSLCRTSTLLNFREVLKWQKGLESLDLLSFQKSITRGSKLNLIDITTMSVLRPDGHTQNWHVKGGKLPPGARDDCTHWCGVGVPDMWVKAVFNFLLGKLAV